MQVLNLCLTFVFVIFAYVSIAHAGEMTSTPLGRSLLLLISLFWYLRAAEQIWFFGLRKPLSILFLLFFLFRHQMKMAGKGAMNFGKSKAKMMALDGKKLTFKGGELYYTKGVEKVLATKLGNFLAREAAT